MREVGWEPKVPVDTYLERMKILYIAKNTEGLISHRVTMRLFDLKQ